MKTKFLVQPLRDGKHSLVISVTHNYRRSRLVTGEYVSPGGFILKGKTNTLARIKGNDADAFKLRNRLLEIEKFFVKLFEEFQEKDLTPTQEELVYRWKVYIGRIVEKPLEPLLLTSFIDMFVSRYRGMAGHGDAHLNHFGSTKIHIENYENSVIEKSHGGKILGDRVTLDNLNKDFYLGFKTYLVNLGFKQNTVSSHLKRIKRVMNEAYNDGLTSNLVHKQSWFTAPEDEVDKVYITQEDLRAFYSMKVGLDNLRKTRDMFVAACFMGLRFGDWNKIPEVVRQMSEITSVKTKKTGAVAFIPIHPIVREIVERLGANFKTDTNESTNRHLKDLGKLAIAQKVGDPEVMGQLSTHTARRSFATNAYLSGIPIPAIMQMTGHATTTSFLKYIRVTKLENALILQNHPFFKS